MLTLEHQLKGLVRKDRTGSRVSQAQREQRLCQAARDLDRLGMRPRVGGLKPRHVEALIDDWQHRGLSAGTIKNRMVDLRWWASTVGKAGVVAGSNDRYGIDRRVFVSNESKARELPAEALAKVTDPHVAMSLRLQAAFGLRREEAIKFTAAYADRGDHLTLKASWCKGGRAREVPIRTPEQRALLADVRALAGAGSLIPPELRYSDQLGRYERQTIRAGLDRMHGLRHAYAQRRYHELTGWPAPAAGGPATSELTPEQRDRDTLARVAISRELGHEREQITAVYLGR